MENKLVKILILYSFFFLTACNKADIRSMFISYESANERFEQSMTWNLQNPFKKIMVSSGSYVIFVMGDSHTGGIKNVNMFFKDALEANASAIVMVGDLTTGKIKDYNIFEDNLINAGDIELFPVVGNHDLYFNGWNEFYSRFGSSTYYFTVKTTDAEDIFICLDSGSGTLGSKQIKWLEQFLDKKRDEYRHCIVFTHNNFFRSRHTMSTNLLVEELYVLLDLFVTYNVDMVITGHDHKKSIEKLGNTTYLVMDALLDGNKNAGYLKIFIDSNKNIEYEFVQLYVGY